VSAVYISLAAAQGKAHYESHPEDSLFHKRDYGVATGNNKVLSLLSFGREIKHTDSVAVTRKKIGSPITTFNSANASFRTKAGININNPANQHGLYNIDL
jgi:hypothetical protein